MAGWAFVWNNDDDDDDGDGDTDKALYLKRVAHKIVTETNKHVAFYTKLWREQDSKL